jgi:hypothetical protein
MFFAYRWELHRLCLELRVAVHNKSGAFSMTTPRRMKKTLLYALIGSVALGALLGIVLVLLNTWGWFEIRVMLTTVIIASASLCGLACELSKTPLGLNLLPRSGLAITSVAAALMLLGMWTDIDSVAYWKVATCIAVFAVATVHVCLLSIARVPKRFFWFQWVAFQVVFALAALIAAHSIIVAAISIVIPILHRIGRLDAQRTEQLMPIDQRNIASIDAEIARLTRQLSELQKLRAKIAGDGVVESIPPEPGAGF